MTHERDFDRLARAWLELGPDQAPDRVIAAVLQAAETTPQVRRPIRWPTWRSIHMTRQTVIATLVAALVVVIGGGIFLTQSHSKVGGVPSPSPSALTTATPVPSSSAAAAPSSSATDETVPAPLRYTWIGAQRVVAGLAARDRFRFELDAANLIFPNDAFTSNDLPSSAAATAPDGLTFVSSDATAGCTKGDVGRYTWALSPGGTRLTLSATADACRARLAALPGDWYRVDCTNTDDGCLGNLEAGTYPSQYIGPRVNPGGSWAPNLGAITYTVPDGWANDADWPDTFSLTPSSDYQLQTKDGGAEGVFHGIFLYTQPAATSIEADCSNAEITSVGRSVNQLVTWLGKQPALTVSKPTKITIDGHPATWVDIVLAPDWTGTCPDSTVQAAPYFMETQGTSNAWGLGIDRGEHTRLVLLDLGDGDVLAIAIDTSDPARFDDLVAQAMPIIGSFHFK